MRFAVVWCLQVARRCYQLLLAHMTRFTYSPTGALKWKKDVSEYAEVLAGYGVPAANEDMAYLQQVRDYTVACSLLVFLLLKHLLLP
jgi:hypothetical protein